MSLNNKSFFHIIRFDTNLISINITNIFNGFYNKNIDLIALYAGNPYFEEQNHKCFSEDEAIKLTIEWANEHISKNI